MPYVTVAHIPPYRNPHPQARCEACEATKRLVTRRECSYLCGLVLYKDDQSKIDECGDFWDKVEDSRQHWLEQRRDMKNHNYE
jgi:hypothetical protein